MNETLVDTTGDAFGILKKVLGIVFSYSSAILYEHKLITSAVILFLVILFRFVMANLIILKRHDKRDWFVWGALFATQVASFFVKIPNTYFIIESVVVVFMFLYIMFIDRVAVVRSLINSQNLIYEDQSDRYNAEKKDKSYKTQRDAKIKRRWDLKGQVKIAYGIPILPQTFSFKQGLTVTNETLSRALRYLGDYFTDYDWKKQLGSGGDRYEFTASLRTNQNLIVPFNKEVSDELDWCCIPLGAIDLSSKGAANRTPYVWPLQDPRKENKSYDCMKDVKLYAYSPHAFIFGSTGGGKSVQLATIIAHLVNKAKTKGQVELYLCDKKMVEFKPYQALEEVKMVACKLEDAVNVTNEMVRIMEERNEMMTVEGMKNIPIDGHVQLKRTVCVNGTIVPLKKIINYKTSDGKVFEGQAYDLLERNDIVEVNLFPEKDKEEEDNGKEERFGGMFGRF